MLKKRYFSLIMVLTLAVILCASTFNYSYGQTVIKVVVDNTALQFDVSPINVSGRVLVPFRGISEALGAEVSWNEATQTVTATKADTTIKLTIGSRTALVNNRSMALDVAPQIINSRTLVPVRFFSESFGSEVSWDGNTQTVYIASKKEDLKLSLKGIALGSSLQEVTKVFGSPKRIDDSEYDFKWYIFHQDYKNYAQIGIKDNQVVAIYSNYDLWDSVLNIGTEEKKATELLTTPIDRIQKGSVIYLLSKNDGYRVFPMENSFLTVFFDIHNSNKVTAIMMVDKGTEEAYLPNKSYASSLQRVYELQAFDLANAVRVREGLPPLTWSDSAASAALKHSNDMAASSYYDHTNQKGEGPFDRMKKAGINYATAGENLAAGEQNAIYAHEGWMHSLGHREILLGDFKRMGVGVAFGGPYRVYYTQNYFTAR